MKIKTICLMLFLILIVGCSKKVIEESQEEKQNFVQEVQVKELTCEEEYNQLTLQYDEIIKKFEELRCNKWINDEEQMKLCKSLNDEALKIRAELKELDCKDS